MTYDELIALANRKLQEKIAARDAAHETLIRFRSELAEGKDVSGDDVTAAISARDAATAEVDAADGELRSLQADKAEDDRIAALRELPGTPTGVRMPGQAVGPVRVGQEPRTYRADTDPKGSGFVRDAVLAHLGDYSSRDRLARHMHEEEVERGGQFVERAAGTAAFAGLVVPQYLTDLVAPLARAGRPLADVIRQMDLPPDGMTVNISRITTGTSAATQTQGSAVSETDIDDTLLSPAVTVVAGSQTVTRQAVERGTGTLDVVLQDLSRAYSTALDSKLINEGTTGLAAVATAIAYTDASPTAAELYPKLLGASAAVEAALLDQSVGDVIAVMHSRRWAWVQSQLSSTFPLIGQGFNVNVAGVVDPASTYGSGFRGFLPSGIPVVVDNNCSTAIGAGTEDEIYFVSRNESFLWEDPGAPMMIRTETGPSVKSLGVDVVVYGYVAYTFTRQAHAQRISGTGLIAPTF